MKFANPTIEIEYIRLSDLAAKFLQGNAKRHDLDTIAASIGRYGFRDPIALDSTLNDGAGGVPEGNGRLEALIMMRDRGEAIPRFVAAIGDDWAVPVLVGANSESESEGLAYSIDHNLTGLKPSDFDTLDLATLFDETYLDLLKSLDMLPLMVSEDDLLLLDGGEEDSFDDRDRDELPDWELVELRVKRGELWQLGQHRLLCGDATQLADIQTLMGDDRASLYLTDPPYNVAYEGKTKDRMHIENDEMDDSSFQLFLAKAFSAADQVMVPGAAFYIWLADTKRFYFEGAMIDVGWQLRQSLVWAKNSLVMGRQDYHWKHEPCLYGWKEGAAHFWGSDRSQTTILEFDKPIRNDIHPTMKPVALMEYLIGNSSQKGAIVLDSFLGSGSTLIACETKNRRCFGLELDEKYASAIVERWETFTGRSANRLG
jgi:DNA modification methylase